MVSIVNEYKSDTKIMMDLFEREVLSRAAPPATPDVALMTVHQSKGLEFKNVQVMEDLCLLSGFEVTGLATGGVGHAQFDWLPHTDNFNMWYVGLTRARSTLSVPSQFKKLVDDLRRIGTAPVHAEQLASSRKRARDDDPGVGESPAGDDDGAEIATEVYASLDTHEQHDVTPSAAGSCSHADATSSVTAHTAAAEQAGSSSHLGSVPHTTTGVSSTMCLGDRHSERTFAPEEVDCLRTKLYAPWAAEAQTGAILALETGMQYE